VLDLEVIAIRRVGSMALEMRCPNVGNVLDGPLRIEDDNRWMGNELSEVRGERQAERPGAVA
jgi:hypothetical protein